MQGLFQNMMRSAGGAATAAFNASQQGPENRPVAHNVTTRNTNPNSQSQETPVEQVDSEGLTPSESSDVSDIDIVD